MVEDGVERSVCPSCGPVMRRGRPWTQQRDWKRAKGVVVVSPEQPRTRRGLT